MVSLMIGSNLSRWLWSTVGNRWWDMCWLKPAKSAIDRKPRKCVVVSHVEATVCSPKSSILSLPADHISWVLWPQKMHFVSEKPKHACMKKNRLRLSTKSCLNRYKITTSVHGYSRLIVNFLLGLMMAKTILMIMLSGTMTKKNGWRYNSVRTELFFWFLRKCANGSNAAIS